MFNQKPLIIAGPCTVESEEHVVSIATRLAQMDVDALRGGAFKPRTSPDTFQGLGKEGLEHLKRAKEISGLPIVTEVLGSEDIGLVASYADVLQIGARNMHNFDLLKKIGARASDKTIILKRGISATKKEVLGAIGYLTSHGHTGQIIVCERGIRTFTNGEYDRFTIDVSFIADLKRDPTFNHMIIIDPSHAAGRADLVADLAYAGIAAGADGIIVEVKQSSEHVPICDAKQAITIEELDVMIKRIQEICEVLGK